MKLPRILILPVVGLLLLAGCKKPRPVTPAAPPTTKEELDPIHGHLLHAQPRLPTVKVWLGDQEMVAEVARSRVQVATGMMFRTNMPENEAMIFVFDFAEPRNFYMRNCVVPLSAAYISPDGEILQIIDLQPHDETGVPSASNNVQFVLETPQGWFKRHNVTTGSIVRTDRGSLRQTFQTNR